jgi:hypothetical protein
MTAVKAFAVLSFVVLVAAPGLAVEPFELPGGWGWTCPSGYWIARGRCWPWTEGPVVEYGGDPDKPRVGNVGTFGAPYMSYSAPSVGPGFVVFSPGVFVLGR